MISLDTIKQIDKNSSIKEGFLYSILMDALKYAPSKILGTLMNLIIVPVYTNIMPPQEYGLYGISISVLSFIAIIFSDWVGFSGLRFFKIHQNSNNTNNFFSTLLFLISTNLILMYILTFTFFNQLKDFFDIPEKFLYAVLLLIMPVALRALLFQILRAQIKPAFYSIFTIINQFSTIALAIYFIKSFNMGAMGIIMGMAFSISIIDLIMLLISKIARTTSIEFINKDTLTSFYIYGVPLAAASLGMWMITQSNKFVLQHYKGSFFNGLSGVGFNLTFSLLLPLFAIMAYAAVPRLINYYEDGKDVKPIITKLTGYFILMFMPVAAFMCCYPKEIVLFFSNEKYLNAAELIPYLVWSTFIYGLTEYTVIQYHLIKKTYINTIIKLVPSILGLIMMVLLIKYNSDKALLYVGISTLLSQVLYLLLSLVIKIKGLEWIPPYKAILKCFVAIIIAFAGLTLFNNNFELLHYLSIKKAWLLQLSVYSIIYAVIVLIMHKKEVIWLLSRK